jgi:hypothetical protein
MLFLDIFTILCTGLMVGSELAVSLFVNPVIWKLEDRSQAKALSLFAGTLGKAMPFLVRIVSRSHGCRDIPSPSSASTDLASCRGGHLDCDYRLYRHHPGAHQQSHCPPGRCIARGMEGRA